MQSALLIQSKEAEAKQAEVAGLIESVQALMTQLESEALSKAQAMKIVRNQQDFMNGMSKNISERVLLTQQENNELVRETQAAKAVLNEYTAKAGDAIKTIEEMDTVNERVNVIAQDMKQSMFAFANNLFRVMGVDRNMALQALNAANVEQRNVLNQGEFDLLVSTFTSVQQGFEDQEQRTNEQSRTALDLLGQPGGRVVDNQ